MKLKTLGLLFCLLSAFASGQALRAAPPSAAGRVDVIFFEREKFTDVKDGFLETPKGRDAILDQLKEHIVSEAKWYVPEGWKLTVTITDIDLAGDYEPARGAAFQDIRVIREIYPPKIDLAFKLVDPDGNETRHGTRQLTDLDFMNRLTLDHQDPLRFEKQLLDDWMRRDLPRVK
ncbi:MAG TPA: DUF3016 domain-containing protein [Opitutaceae bacterium]|nr:DUF3016 domain-containing protein [Opitutaceae bacterium]